MQTGKVYKRLPLLFLTFFMSFLFSQAVFARDVKVFYNGNEIKYDVPAQIISDRTMVPLSQTFEALVGKGTVYNPATKTSTFYANGHENVHTIGTNVVYVDGVAIVYDSPSMVIGDRALVPIRMITDTSGLKVDWDPINYFVKITSATPSTPTPQPAPVATPTAAPPPLQIISFESTKTTLNAGESIILTVKTNSSVTNVWVNDGTQNMALTYATLDPNGIKTWVLSYSPKQTATFTAYANTTQSTGGAATRQLTLSVNASPPSISGATANKTTISPNEAVTVTVKTSSSATNVWVECNNSNVQATFSSEASGVKTWTATVYPNSTQTLRILANTSQSTTGAAQHSITVTVGSSTILSVSANKTVINNGEAVTYTIKTNSSTNYVWVECNNTMISASYNSVDLSGVKTYVATVYPSSSQQMRILANTTQTTTGATVYTQYITVNAQATVNISSVNANPSSIYSGQSTELTVTTNSSASYVWADTGGQNVNLTHQYTDTNGNKVWKAQIYPTSSRSIPIYASRNYGSAEATSSVYISVQGSSTGAVIYSSTASPDYVNESGPLNISFTITTNAETTAVEIFAFDGTSRYITNYSYSGSNKVWYTTMPLRWNGAYDEHGFPYEAVYVTAFGSSDDFDYIHLWVNTGRVY